MDINDYHYPEGFLETTKAMQDAIAPALKILNDMDPIMKNVNQIFQQHSLLINRDILSPSISKVIRDHNKSISEMISPGIISLIQGLDLPAMNIAKQISESIPRYDFSHVLDGYKSAMQDLSKYDFRIGVVSQEFEEVFSENTEEVTEKLFFKQIPEPSNNLEAQVFDILNEQRQIMEDCHEMLKEIKDTKSNNISNQESEINHNPPAFYKDKMWYLEQVSGTMIGLVITGIFEITIGVNPHNTVLFAMLLRCFLLFLK